MSTPRETEESFLSENRGRRPLPSSPAAWMQELDLGSIISPGLQIVTSNKEESVLIGGGVCVTSTFQEWQE